jgi:hypothetical protein
MALKFRTYIIYVLAKLLLISILLLVVALRRQNAIQTYFGHDSHTESLLLAPAAFSRADPDQDSAGSSIPVTVSPFSLSGLAALLSPFAVSPLLHGSPLSVKERCDLCYAAAAANGAAQAFAGSPALFSAPRARDPLLYFEYSDCARLQEPSDLVAIRRSANNLLMPPVDAAASRLAHGYGRGRRYGGDGDRDAANSDRHAGELSFGFASEAEAEAAAADNGAAAAPAAGSLLAAALPVSMAELDKSKGNGAPPEPESEHRARDPLTSDDGEGPYRFSAFSWAHMLTLTSTLDGVFVTALLTLTIVAAAAVALCALLLRALKIGTPVEEANAIFFASYRTLAAYTRSRRSSRRSSAAVPAARRAGSGSGPGSGPGSGDSAGASASASRHGSGLAPVSAVAAASFAAASAAAALPVRADSASALASVSSPLLAPSPLADPHGGFVSAHSRSQSGSRSRSGSASGSADSGSGSRRGHQGWQRTLAAAGEAVEMLPLVLRAPLAPAAAGPAAAATGAISAPADASAAAAASFADDDHDEGGPQSLREAYARAVSAAASATGTGTGASGPCISMPIAHIASGIVGGETGSGGITGGFTSARAGPHSGSTGGRGAGAGGGESVPLLAAQPSGLTMTSEGMSTGESSGVRSGGVRTAGVGSGSTSRACPGAGPAGSNLSASHHAYGSAADDSRGSIGGSAGAGAGLAPSTVPAGALSAAVIYTAALRRQSEAAAAGTGAQSQNLNRGDGGGSTRVLLLPPEAQSADAVASPLQSLSSGAADRDQSHSSRVHNHNVSDNGGGNGGDLSRELDNNPLFGPHDARQAADGGSGSSDSSDSSGGDDDANVFGDLSADVDSPLFAHFVDSPHLPLDLESGVVAPLSAEAGPSSSAHRSEAGDDVLPTPTTLQCWTATPARGFALSLLHSVTGALTIILLITALNVLTVSPGVDVALSVHDIAHFGPARAPVTLAAAAALDAAASGATAAAVSAAASSAAADALSRDWARETRALLDGPARAAARADKKAESLLVKQADTPLAQLLSPSYIAASEQGQAASDDQSQATAGMGSPAAAVGAKENVESFTVPPLSPAAEVFVTAGALSAAADGSQSSGGGGRNERDERKARALEREGRLIGPSAVAAATSGPRHRLIALACPAAALSPVLFLLTQIVLACYLLLVVGTFFLRSRSLLSYVLFVTQVAAMHGFALLVVVALVQASAPALGGGALPGLLGLLLLLSLFELPLVLVGGKALQSPRLALMGWWRRLDTISRESTRFDIASLLEQ